MTNDPTPDAATIEQAAAYLKLWKDFGTDRVRVDLSAECEPWLTYLKPTIIPLYTEAALRSRSDLREATTAFLAKWDKIEPAINNAFAIAHNHGATYHGPTIEAEIIDLRLALATPITAAGDRG